MNTKETASMLEDEKVNVKAKLALLWVALMFFYIYNDLFRLLQPGHIAQLVEGQLGGVQFTQSMLFGAAVLMAFPSIMVLLCLTLKARVNRLVNIIVGILLVFVLLGTQFVGEGEVSDVWFYWRLYELLEALFLALIIWTAWKWPKSTA